MAHRVVDVSGSAAAAATAPFLLRRRGAIAAASPISAGGDIAMALPHMVWNQIRWQGVLSNRPVAAEPAAALLAANGDRLAPLITHRFHVSQTDAAIDAVAAADSNAIKVVVLANGSGPIGSDARSPLSASR
jgi:threonine dehydrogenase-like Zn-dependent dehydrogenase